MKRITNAKRHSGLNCDQARRQDKVDAYLDTFDEEISEEAQEVMVEMLRRYIECDCLDPLRVEDFEQPGATEFPEVILELVEVDAVGLFDQPDGTMIIHPIVALPDLPTVQHAAEHGISVH